MNFSSSSFKRKLSFISFIALTSLSCSSSVFGMDKSPEEKRHAVKATFIQNLETFIKTVHPQHQFTKVDFSNLFDYNCLPTKQEQEGFLIPLNEQALTNLLILKTLPFPNSTLPPAQTSPFSSTSEKSSSQFKIPNPTTARERLEKKLAQRNVAQSLEAPSTISRSSVRIQDQQAIPLINTENAQNNPSPKERAEFFLLSCEMNREEQGIDGSNFISARKQAIQAFNIYPSKRAMWFIFSTDEDCPDHTEAIKLCNYILSEGFKNNFKTKYKKDNYSKYQDLARMQFGLMAQKGWIPGGLKKAEEYFNGLINSDSITNEIKQFVLLQRTKIYLDKSYLGIPKEDPEKTLEDLLKDAYGSLENYLKAEIDDIRKDNNKTLSSPQELQQKTDENPTPEQSQCFQKQKQQDQFQTISSSEKGPQTEAIEKETKKSMADNFFTIFDDEAEYLGSQISPERKLRPVKTGDVFFSKAAVATNEAYPPQRLIQATASEQHSIPEDRPWRSQKGQSSSQRRGHTHQESERRTQSFERTEVQGSQFQPLRNLQSQESGRNSERFSRKPRVEWPANSRSRESERNSQGFVELSEENASNSEKIAMQGAQVQRAEKLSSSERGRNVQPARETATPSAPHTQGYSALSHTKSKAYAASSSKISQQEAPKTEPLQKRDRGRGRPIEVPFQSKSVEVDYTRSNGER